MRRQIGEMDGAGLRKLKKTLRALKRSGVSTAFQGKSNGAHPPIEQRDRPMNHIRIVSAYMLGSSVSDTEALTSGKGLPLSIASGLNSGKKDGYGGSAAGLK